MVNNSFTYFAKFLTPEYIDPRELHERLYESVPVEDIKRQLRSIGYEVDREDFSNEELRNAARLHGIDTEKARSVPTMQEGITELGEEGFLGDFTLNPRSKTPAAALDHKSQVTKNFEKTMKIHFLADDFKQSTVRDGNIVYDLSALTSYQELRDKEKVFPGRPSRRARTIVTGVKKEFPSRIGRLLDRISKDIDTQAKKRKEKKLDVGLFKTPPETDAIYIRNKLYQELNNPRSDRKIKNTLDLVENIRKADKLVKKIEAPKTIGYKTDEDLREALRLEGVDISGLRERKDILDAAKKASIGIRVYQKGKSDYVADMIRRNPKLDGDSLFAMPLEELKRKWSTFMTSYQAPKTVFVEREDLPAVVNKKLEKLYQSKFGKRLTDRVINQETNEILRWKPYLNRGQAEKEAIKSIGAKSLPPQTPSLLDEIFDRFRQYKYPTQPDRRLNASDLTELSKMTANKFRYKITKDPVTGSTRKKVYIDPKIWTSGVKLPLIWERKPLKTKTKRIIYQMDPKGNTQYIKKPIRSIIAEMAQEESKAETQFRGRVEKALDKEIRVAEEEEIQDIVGDIIGQTLPKGFRL